MSISTFLASWWKASSRPATRRPSRPRLGLEALEDRAVPAALVPVGLLDPDVLFGAAKVNNGHHNGTPWELRGQGQIDVVDGVYKPNWSGTSTLIGKYTASGILVVAENGQDFSGSGTYTAANGDTIEFSYTGRFEKPLGSEGDNPFSGEATFSGGTGRFANPDGEVTYEGVLNGLSFLLTHTGELKR